MKKLFVTLFVSLTITLVNGQDMTVTSTRIPVTDIVVDAWSATLNDDISFYKDTFEDFVKQEYGAKAKNDGKTELVVEKVSVSRVSPNRGDLRLSFFTEGSGTKVGLSFLLGYDIWVNPEQFSDGFEQLRILTRDYLRFHYTNYYNDIIDKDLKMINGYKKDIEKAEKSISNMRKQITRNEGRLREETSANRRASMERRNQQNREDIEKLTAEIPELHAKIAALDDHVQQMKDNLRNVEEQYYNDQRIPSPDPVEDESIDNTGDSDEINYDSDIDLL